MEGVKILSEEVISVATNNVEVCLLLVFCFIMGALSYIFFANEERLIGFLALIVATCSLIGSVLWWRLAEVEIKEYKVTPIEDKCFINAMEYEVIDTKQEIITVREKVKNK